MKNFVGKIFIGRNAKFNVLLVLCVFVFVGLGCFGSGRNRDDNPVPVANTNSSTDNSTKSDKSSKKTDEDTDKKKVTKKANAAKWEVPEDDEMQEMTRAALTDFNSAVQDGDFTDFHSKISKTWQKQTTPEQFNTAFSEFISKKVDISNVESSEAEFSSSPSVEMDKGMKKLIANGCYNISPRDTKFVLKWIPEGKEWKLFGIEVDTTGSC